MNHLGLDSESYLKSVVTSWMQQYMMHQRCLSGFRGLWSTIRNANTDATAQHLFSQWVWGFQLICMQQFHYNDECPTLSTGLYIHGNPEYPQLWNRDEYKPSDWFLMVNLNKSQSVEKSFNFVLRDLYVTTGNNKVDEPNWLSIFIRLRACLSCCINGPPLSYSWCLLKDSL